MSWHIVTCEFPPALGGVADFSRVMATGLAASGEQVHVWSPGPANALSGVQVHRHSGYQISHLGAVGRQVDAVEGPRRLFVQWVPHGYGYKSLNLPFCLWIWRRARRGDRVDLMVHEPYLPFDRRRIRQNVGALAHRLMLMVLLRAADRVWVSTPSFLPMVRPYGPSGDLVYSWLPVPSPIDGVDTPRQVQARRQALAGSHPVVGYFGTASPLIADVVEAVIVETASRRPDVKFVLLGRGTAALAQRLEARMPSLARAIVARGEHPGDEIGTLIQCCDVFVQPYPDGVSRRRTTVMALLKLGCAVVASRGVRTEDGWQDVVCLTPDRDPASMSEAAVRLLDQPDRRRRLSHDATRAYAEHYSAERAVATLLEAHP